MKEWVNKVNSSSFELKYFFKLSVARAGRLQECKNTEFVWDMRKTGFCEGGRWVDLSAYESVWWERFHRTVVSSMTKPF